MSEKKSLLGSATEEEVREAIEEWKERLEKQDVELKDDVVVKLPGGYLIPEKDIVEKSTAQILSRVYDTDSKVRDIFARSFGGA